MWTNHRQPDLWLILANSKAGMWSEVSLISTLRMPTCIFLEKQRSIRATSVESRAELNHTTNSSSAASSVAAHRVKRSVYSNVRRKMRWYWRKGYRELNNMSITDGAEMLRGCWDLKQSVGQADDQGLLTLLGFGYLPQQSLARLTIRQFEHATCLSLSQDLEDVMSKAEAARGLWLPAAGPTHSRLRGCWPHGFVPRSCHECCKQGAAGNEGASTQPKPDVC